MEIKEMSIEQIEDRKTAIATEVEVDGADLDALEAEVRSLNTELEERKAQAEKQEEVRKAISEGKMETKVVEERKAETKMTDIEVRNSKEYIDAFANYIKTEDASECRSLLTSNATNGTVAVPTFVEGVVKRAWEKEGIMALVKKAYAKGNLKVGFEISSDGAVIHTEGSGAVNEENLVLGTVELIPASIKKWISISDEVMDMRGEEFLTYIYEEVAHYIAKKCADTLIAKIVACGTASTSTSVAVPVITTTSVSVGLVAKALGNLSDESTNPVITMNKQTWAEFKAVQYANNYAVDPFEGLDVKFNNTLPAFSAATTGDTFVIVGDYGYGSLANFPNGNGIAFKFDDKTEMTKDLVRVLGRQYVGLGVVAPMAFVKINKA